MGDVIVTNDHYIHFINTLYGSYHWKVSLTQILPKWLIRKYQERIVVGFIYKISKKSKKKNLIQRCSLDIMEIILRFYGAEKKEEENSLEEEEEDEDYLEMLRLIELEEEEDRKYF